MSPYGNDSIKNFVFSHLPQMPFIFKNLHIQIEMLNLYVYIYIKYKCTVHIYLIANQTHDLVFASTIE